MHIMLLEAEIEGFSVVWLIPDKLSDKISMFMDDDDYALAGVNLGIHFRSDRQNQPGLAT